MAVTYPTTMLKLVGGALPSVQHAFLHRPIITAQQNIYGGQVINPADESGQHVPVAEPLFVSLIGPAELEANDTTTALQPGAIFNVPAGTAVWVNAATDKHFYTAVFGVGEAQLTPTPVPVGGSFPNWPPDGPTGLTYVLYAYLYQEYSDDDDLQAFVRVLNEMQQDYVDTFNAIQLPIYPNVPPPTGQPKTEPSAIMEGALADWTMHGIYGWLRPVFYSTRGHLVGPLNTYWLNYALPLNMIQFVEPKGVLVADDDLYKRALTWHFQKGDGKHFNIRWLKRRVMRFLIGVNGTCPHIDNTDRISIEFGPNWGVTIRILMRETVVVGGAICNMFGCNGLLPGLLPQPQTVPLNTVFLEWVDYPPLPYAKVFQEAIAAGILELPFQFRFNVHIG